MAEKLEFDISVKNNDLQKALNQASNSASTLSSYFAGGLKPSIDEAIKSTKNIDKEMSSFASTVLGVAGGNIIFSTLTTSIGFLSNTVKESVAAFAEQEEALNKLGQSLTATGAYSEITIKSVEDFATSLESVSKFSDDAIIRQVAFVKSLGATTEQAKQLVLAAANLSATLGGSLEENTDKLGKTLSGTSGRLAMYIPELKSLTEEQLKAGAAADVINQKWSGAAANDLKTYTGQVASLGNTYNNLQEEIGKLIVKNSLVETSSNVLKDVFKSLTDTLKSYNDNLSKNDTSKIGQQATVSAEKLVLLDKEISQVQDQIKLGLIGSSLDPDAESVESLRLQLQKLTEQRAKLQEQQPYLKDTAKAPVETQRLDEETAKQKEALAKRNAEILAITQQAELEKNNFLTQQSDLRINNEFLSQAAEIERINNFNTQKAEIEANSKKAIAEGSLTGEEQKLEIQKINADKELAVIKSNDEKKIALQKLNIKARQDGEKAMTDFDKKQAQEREATQRDSLSKIATLSNENNKTLAAIGKAAALTQIAIDGPQAVTKAYAAFPPPFGFAAAAAVAAAVAVQAGKVAGVKFEQGGFVGGANGATVGSDNRIAQVRDGEMILNASQQRNLLNMINSGTSVGDIIVQVDGREIARAVRNQVQSGFRLA